MTSTPWGDEWPVVKTKLREGARAAGTDGTGGVVELTTYRGTAGQPSRIPPKNGWVAGTSANVLTWLSAADVLPLVKFASPAYWTVIAG